MRHLKFFVLAILVGAAMALFEIQIEGSSGWAANLPTWRVDIHLPMMGMWWGSHEKPLTGYHLYLWVFSFLLLHSAVLFSKWNWKKELNLISFYVFFTTIEGLLWFVLNPAWGWQKFRYGIPWYKEQWILGLPGEYWLRLTLGFVLYFVSRRNANPKDKALEL
jgi:hypothetical protein